MTYPYPYRCTIRIDALFQRLKLIEQEDWIDLILYHSKLAVPKLKVADEYIVKQISTMLFLDKAKYNMKIQHAGFHCLLV